MLHYIFPVSPASSVECARQPPLLIVGGPLTGYVVNTNLGVHSLQPQAPSRLDRCSVFYSTPSQLTFELRELIFFIYPPLPTLRRLWSPLSVYVYFFLRGKAFSHRVFLMLPHRILCFAYVFTEVRQIQRFSRRSSGRPPLIWRFNACVNPDSQKNSLIWREVTNLRDRSRNLGEREVFLGAFFFFFFCLLGTLYRKLSFWRCRRSEYH